MTSSNSAYNDQPVNPRPGDLPDKSRLVEYLAGKLEGFGGSIDIRQYPGGYSNLTFLLQWETGYAILRKPPNGADIKSAHDMHREFRVLSALHPAFPKVPKPILYCDDITVMGTPFYLMEKVTGIILRNTIPRGLDLGPGTMRGISEAAIRCLSDLHNVDIHATGLYALGRPEGYVKRQTEGWIGRYEKSATDDIPGVRKIADWMRANLPKDNRPSFIHNDFKFDNTVLDPTDLSRIIAVLDWEMATVGDPLMDLGTTLAYWCEADDSPALKPFNLTWLPGNLTREEVVRTYASMMGTDIPDMLFYYVFGCFKIGVIVQQIYARYKKGLTNDQRFAGLIHVLHACVENAENAIRSGRISQLGKK
jgi:aminoglycoside phosphotransferase (APT) family kinase protein